MARTARDLRGIGEEVNSATTGDGVLNSTKNAGHRLQSLAAHAAENVPDGPADMGHPEQRLGKWARPYATSFAARTERFRRRRIKSGE